MPSQGDLLEVGARSLGVDLDLGTRARLQQFCALLRTANQAFNLVSRQDIDRLESRHVLDCLALGVWMQNNFPIGSPRKLLDIGSGGGFPGMVLAILWPDVAVTLVDRSAKKARFLERTAAGIGLVNTEVKCHDVEVDPLAERFDYVTSRAVATVEKMWPWASECLVPGGRFVHMSYVVGSIERVQRRVDDRGDTVVLQIPGLDSQHVVTVVRKTQAGDQTT